MVYVIEPDSELCDLKTVNKLINAEAERDALKLAGDELDKQLTLYYKGEGNPVHAYYARAAWKSLTTTKKENEE